MSVNLFDKTLELKVNKLSIDTLNRLVFDKCKFIPWVGSGISKPNNLPMWGEWIESIYLDIYCEDISDSNLSADFKLGNYSNVVEIISKEHPVQFNTVVRNSFGLKIIPEKPLGPINKLTSINHSLVITTNIDELIEHYLGFKCVLPTDDEKIKKISNGNATKSLIKLHGTYGNIDSWVLTESQYKSKYTNESFVEIAEKILLLGHFIFLGTSFIGDKPSELLRIMTRGRKFPNQHFLFIPIKEEKIDHIKMMGRRKLFNKLNIYPIFYFVSNEDKTHGVLSELIDHFFLKSKLPSNTNTNPIVNTEIQINKPAVQDSFHDFLLNITYSAIKNHSSILSNNIANHIKKEKFDFAFLFGECGDGKTTFIQKISAELNCHTISLETKNFSEFREYAKNNITFEKLFSWLGIDQKKQYCLIIDSLDEFFKTASPGELASYFNSIAKMDFKIIFGVRKNTLTFKYLNNSLSRYSNRFIYQIWEIPKLRGKKIVKEFLFKFGRDRSSIEKTLSINNISNKSRIDYIILSELIENKPEDYSKEVEPILITKYVEYICEKLITEKGVLINISSLFRLAFKLSMGNKIQFDSNLGIVNPEFKELNDVISTLISSGLLSIDKDDFIIFNNLKITEACSAKFFIDSIFSNNFDELMQSVNYFSKDFYSYVSQITHHKNITIPIINQMIWLQDNKDFKEKIINEVQFHLACSFTYSESTNSIPFLREWWEKTSFNRVKQKLAEALYLAGDKETMHDYLMALINKKDSKINNDTNKGVSYSTFVHFGRRYEIDDSTYELIIQAFSKSPKSRKYLASMLARTNRIESMPLLLESLDWVDVYGRQKVYIIDSMGYLATEEHIDYINIKREQDKDNFYQVFYQSAIEQINSRLSKRCIS
jgi:SIR2-like domain